MKYVFDLKYIIYSAEGISPLKLSFKQAQSKLYRETWAFFDLVACLEMISVAGVGSRQGILRGGVRWCESQAILTNTYNCLVSVNQNQFAFCSSINERKKGRDGWDGWQKTDSSAQIQTWGADQVHVSVVFGFISILHPDYLNDDRNESMASRQVILKKIIAKLCSETKLDPSCTPSRQWPSQTTFAHPAKCIWSPLLGFGGQSQPTRLQQSCGEHDPTTLF